MKKLKTASLNSQAVRVLNIAHRGARGYAPENTLPAFSKAIDMGVDCVELDVHLTRDGKIVVHHDDQLIRCTNITEFEFSTVKTNDYQLSNYSLEEIKSLDAGSWYVREYQLSLNGNSKENYLNILTDEEREMYISQTDLRIYASGDIKIPTLEEVLSLTRTRDCLVNIEIKTLPRMYECLTEKVVQLVETMDLADRTILSSFDHQQLLVAKQLNDRVYTAVLSSDRLAKPNEYLKLLNADAYSPGCSEEYDSLGFHSVSGVVDPTAINLCRHDGFDVNVWTCNDKSQMKTLIDLGVTGLFTDIPNRVNDLLYGET